MSKRDVFGWRGGVQFTRQHVQRNVYELACDRVDYLYRTFDDVIVAHSGGKDSTVTMECALEVARARNRLPLEVVFCDEEINYPTTREYFERLRKRSEVNLRWLCCPWEWRNSIARSWWWSWDSRERERWVFDLPAGAETWLPGWSPRTMQASDGFILPRKRGNVALLIGQRAQESPVRLFGVCRRTFENWITPNASDPDAQHIVKPKPIYDWSFEDVWTGINKFQWDYNHAYDLMVKWGFPKMHQRIAQPFHDEGLVNVGKYAEMFPEWWSRVLRRMPEAAVAARYAESPVFAWKAALDKRADLTWTDLLTKELSKWPAKERVQIVGRMRDLLRQHTMQTGTEFVPQNDPDETASGLTLQKLYAMAVRGDLKQRRIRNQSKVRHAAKSAALQRTTP